VIITGVFPRKAAKRQSAPALDSGLTIDGESSNTIFHLLRHTIRTEEMVHQQSLYEANLTQAFLAFNPVKISPSG